MEQSFRADSLQRAHRCNAALCTKHGDSELTNPKISGWNLVLNKSHPAVTSLPNCKPEGKNEQVDISMLFPI